MGLQRGSARTVADRQEAQETEAKKKVPTGLGQVGTKVGVWEYCRLAQNSKAVGSQSDSWGNYLSLSLRCALVRLARPGCGRVELRINGGRRNPPAAARRLRVRKVREALARVAPKSPPQAGQQPGLPRLICFGDDFQARPAFEAGQARIALDLHASGLHRIFACRAKRCVNINVLLSSIVARIPKINRQATRSIARFAITEISLAPAASAGRGRQPRIAIRTEASRISHRARDRMAAIARPPLNPRIAFRALRRAGSISGAGPISNVTRAPWHLCLAGWRQRPWKPSLSAATPFWNNSNRWRRMRRRAGSGGN
jgi:hypothetical protein